MFHLNDLSLNDHKASPAEELNRHSSIPLYHQLKEILRSQIEGGKWKQGDVIPNEFQIARDYGLSRGTVREAMDDLVQDGLLVKERGRGTFVAAPKFEHDLFFSLHEYTKQSGHTPGSNILDFSTESAAPRVREILQLPEYSQVYRINRVRLIDGEPIMFDLLFLSANDFPGLWEKDISNRSLYEILKKDYQVALGKAYQTLEPVLINAFESKLLNVSKGNPALLIERITRRMNGSPVMYSKIIIRGDRCRFVTEVPGNA